MAKVVSLSRARKQKQLLKTRVQADANAAKSGLSKVEKLRQQAEAERAAAKLDAQLRDPG